jgi:hypothetical protein
MGKKKEGDNLQPYILHTDAEHVEPQDIMLLNVQDIVVGVGLEVGFSKKMPFMSTCLLEYHLKDILL